MYVYLIYVHHAHLLKNRSVEKVYFNDYNRAEAILLKGWGRGIEMGGMDVD